MLKMLKIRKHLKVMTLVDQRTSRKENEMTDLRPIAPSGFDPTAGGEVFESSKPADSGMESGFYTTDRGLPWHVSLSRQLGEAELMTGVGGLLTGREALAAASADFAVEKWPLTAKGHDGDEAEVPRWYATVRTDTGQVLGVVGQGYQVLQNRDAFAFTDALVDSGEAMYETAGVLQGGAKTFLSMEVPAHMHVAGDPSDYRLYLVFSNGHDGKTAARAYITVERTVCRNTLRIGRQRSISQWTARHSGSMDGKLEAARQALGLSFKAAEVFAETASAMVATSLVDRQVDDLLAAVFPLTEHQQERVDEDPDVLLKLPVGVARRIYDESPSVLRGTAYGVVNAVTEYMDHAATFGSRVNSAEDVKAKTLMFSSESQDPKRAAWQLVAAATAAGG